MKKTIAFLATIALTVVVGAFTSSLINTKIRSRNKATAPQAQESASLASRAPSTPPPAPKAVFYTSVGGSSPTSNDSSSANRISSRFTIEIAALSSQSDAEHLLMKLKSKGIDGFYTPVRRSGEVIYRVRTGMFTNMDDAEKSLLKVASLSNVKGTVAKLQ
jgi:cell division septation protein DedD